MQLVHIFDLPDEHSCYGCPMFGYVSCFDEYVCNVTNKRKKTPDRKWGDCPLRGLKSVMEYGMETFFWREIEQEVKEQEKQ